MPVASAALSTVTRWFNAPGESLQTVDAQALPPEAYPGVAGLPGLTA